MSMAGEIDGPTCIGAVTGAPGVSSTPRVGGHTERRHGDDADERVRFVEGILQSGSDVPTIDGKYIAISIGGIIDSQITRARRLAVQHQRGSRLSRGDVFNSVVNAEISGVEVGIARDESDFRTL